MKYNFAEHIDGFDSMSEAEKLTAIQNYEFEEPKESFNEKKYKDLISQYTSEISTLKKAAKDKMTEQERLEAERKEREAEMEAQLKGYKDRERVATYTAKLMACGFDQKSADAMATELPEGITDAFFEAQSNFIAQKEQEIKTKKVNSQPNLSSGMPMNGKPAVDEADKMLREIMGLK